MTKRINVGLIGVGWIGRLHAENYLRVTRLCPLPGVTVTLKAVADVNRDAAQQVAADFGFERCYQDWREMVADPEIDLVDICTPNVLHQEIAVAAAAAGKHVFCEKPMSMSPEQGRTMVEAVEAAGVRHMVNFNYRRVPAVTYAKQLVEEGELGSILHFRAGFTQDFYSDPQKPWTWRFTKESAGAGSLATLGSHVFDLSRYLVGDITSLVADLDTVIPERPMPEGGTGRVDVDDIASMLVRFAGGRSGVIYTSWVAHGRKCHIEWELHGSAGSLFWNSERMNELQLYEASGAMARQGFKTILVGEHHPYADIFKNKSGMGIGYQDTFLLQLYELLKGIAEDRPLSPSFYDGWQVDRILHAVGRSAAEGAWVNV